MAVVKKLSNSEISQLLADMTTAIEFSDTAFKLIAEDASRPQIERLDIIKHMAERHREKLAPLLAHLATIRKSIQ